MNAWWLLLAGVGSLISSWSIATARGPAIPAAEARVFGVINGWPNALFWPFWVPMQLGNLWIGGAVGMLAALVSLDPGVAIGAVAVMVLKVLTERVLERALGDYVRVRQRPGTSEVGAVRHGGDVPLSGPSFPSGHVILVAGVWTVIATTLPLPWLWAPVLAVSLVMLGRVYVGAHNPLDVTAGLGAGLFLGGIIAVFIG